MPEPLKRHADRIKIQLNNESSLANVVSIQPIFHEDGIIKESYLFFLYRKVKSNHFKYCCETRLRIGDENKIIHDNLIPYTRLNARLYWTMYKNARHFYLIGHQSRWWRKRERLLYELNSTGWMMKCSNKSFLGDTLICSDPKSFKHIQSKNRHRVSGYNHNYKFLFSDPPVPHNMLVQTCSGDTNFDRPIVACPILNKAHFQEFCAAKNSHIENIPVVVKNSVYPISQRFYQIYKLYEEYINDYPPKWWYVENLGGELAKNYYTFIRFYVSQTKKGKEKRIRYTRQVIAERNVYRRRLKREREQKELDKKQNS